MKKGLWAALAVWLALSGGAASARGDAIKTHIRILFDGKEAVVALLDNEPAKEFLSLLPLTVTLEDYAGSEKISSLPHKLNKRGGRNAEQEKGDFCYYAPWGNLAVFYKGMGYGASLYVLGRIESGKEALAAMNKSFTATMERLR